MELVSKVPWEMFLQVLGSVLVTFKHHLLRAQEQQFLNVRSQAGEAEGLADQGFLLEIRWKRKVCVQWKQCQVIWEEHRDAAPHCWEKIHTGKAQLESKLPKLQRTIIFFFKYINGKKQFRNNIALFQDEDDQVTLQTGTGTRQDV